MKLCIASHIVLDEIVDLDGKQLESLGGPVCYGSLLAKTFKFDPSPATKVGTDISDKVKTLKEYGINLVDSQIDPSNPTTRFKLKSKRDGGRELFLLSRCSPIKLIDIPHSDGLVVSPVIGEISADTLSEIVKSEKNRFVMVDPQGFLRNASEDGSVTNKKHLDLDLKGVTAIKADEDELSALTGGLASLEGMKMLKKKYGIEHIISTSKTDIIFLNKNIVYSIKIKKIDSPDHTGLGDILATSFTCAYLKEKDPLWAISFGAGSVISALQSKKRGIEKIPSSLKLIEKNSTYIYNTIKFKVID
ncbi:PfkB family carbohydrate kinase [Candidatus Nitrosocosmicus franklandus]|uniref:PfkB family carbohydrate kinase n=1 Tax=Candidatus Nitrosocosmicus franklandianus TaxID=1798806 RepID=A0A484IBE5_9ARCH|nr:PfkB family carbohydrate kinase [Candidatus Nitrosocosmicus franklandus]VFJ12339.1 PfkB family carbohydrate kinase [Candidatus Nitrosocosmicus franklandus]